MSLDKLAARKLGPEEIAHLVQTLIREITPMDGLQEALLFGSAARAEMSEASDIDVVLIFDSEELAKSSSKLVHLKRKKSLEWPTDIICVHRATFEERSRLGGVFMIAREDGKVVYRRRENDPVSAKI